MQGHGQMQVAILVWIAGTRLAVHVSNIVPRRFEEHYAVGFDRHRHEGVAASPGFVREPAIGVGLDRMPLSGGAIRRTGRGRLQPAAAISPK